MTTLQLRLDDDLNAFVLRQSRARGFASPEAYIESLLALDRLRNRSEYVDAKLREALESTEEPLEVDDEYWKRLDVEVFGNQHSDDEA